jgi:hypothetical protein
MKIPQPNQKRGSVLLVTMIFVMTTAVIVGSYLCMVQNSDQLVARAQCWNDALALAEAGVEESLASLNAGNGNTFSRTSISRNFNNGSYQAWFKERSVTNQAYIKSIGNVTVPLTGDVIQRTVIVRSAQSALFMMGLVSINNINFHGNGIASDSWNSFDPSQSTNGIYNGYVGTNGDVASIYGIVDIGNHTINGNLWLGPNATFTGSPANVTGLIYTDVNLSFSDASLPTPDALGWQTAPQTTTGSGKNAVTTHDITSSGYYVINDSYPVVIEAGVTATLDVQQSSWNPTSININGGTTNSGTVSLYLESGSATMAGNSNGGASGNRPENLYVYGLPAVTSITLSGSSSFVGAIYAPEAVLTLNGGGNANNLIGAAVVNSVTLNGHYDFHYDTALATNGINRGFVVASWQEQ